MPTTPPDVNLRSPYPPPTLIDFPPRYIGFDPNPNPATAPGRPRRSYSLNPLDIPLPPVSISDITHTIRANLNASSTTLASFPSSLSIPTAIRETASTGFETVSNCTGSLESTLRVTKNRIVDVGNAATMSLAEMLPDVSGKANRLLFGRRNTSVQEEEWEHTDWLTTSSSTSDTPTRAPSHTPSDTSIISIASPQSQPSHLRIKPSFSHLQSLLRLQKEEESLLLSLLHRLRAQMANHNHRKVNSLVPLLEREEALEEQLASVKKAQMATKQRMAEWREDEDNWQDRLGEWWMRVGKGK